MSKKVYSLKRATGLMKIVHMRNMMEFKTDLEEKQNAANDGESRHYMLGYIKEIWNGFNDWYDKVYALRRDGKQAEYETAITQKYNDLRSEDELERENNWLSDTVNCGEKVEHTNRKCLKCGHVFTGKSWSACPECVKTFNALPQSVHTPNKILPKGAGASWDDHEIHAYTVDGS